MLDHIKMLTEDRLFLLVHSIFILSIMICILYLSSRILRYYRHKLRDKLSSSAKTVGGNRNKLSWELFVLTAIKHPLYIIILLVGFTNIAELIILDFNLKGNFRTEYIRIIGITGAIGWFLLRLTYKLEKYLLEYSTKEDAKITRTTADVVSKLIYVSIIVIVALTILETLGFSISGILAVGGLGGIIIGFAAKDTISGLFGALMIYFDKPFVVGDTVCLALDKAITEGVIEKIGWRMTRLRTLDKKIAYIPNLHFITSTVENASHAFHRKLSLKVDMLYGEQFSTIIEFFELLKLELTQILTEKMKSGGRKVPEHMTPYAQQLVSTQIEITDINNNLIRVNVGVLFLNYITNDDFDRLKQDAVMSLATIIRSRYSWFSMHATP